MKEHRNDRSQSQRGDQQENQQGNQRNDKRAASPGTSGRDAAAQSEQRLDQEERSLVGNTAEDRNLTGSTTYVTLPEQQGDETTRRDQRNASGSQSGSQQSSGRSNTQRSTSSRSANDRDTPR